MENVKRAPWSFLKASKDFGKLPKCVCAHLKERKYEIIVTIETNRATIIYDLFLFELLFFRLTE